MKICSNTVSYSKASDKEFGLLRSRPEMAPYNGRREGKDVANGRNRQLTDVTGRDVLGQHVKRDHTDIDPQRKRVCNALTSKTAKSKEVSDGIPCEGKSKQRGISAALDCKAIKGEKRDDGLSGKGKSKRKRASVTSSANVAENGEGPEAVPGKEKLDGKGASIATADKMMERGHAEGCMADEHKSKAKGAIDDIFAGVKRLKQAKVDEMVER